MEKNIYSRNQFYIFMSPTSTAEKESPHITREQLVLDLEYRCQWAYKDWNMIVEKEKRTFYEDQIMTLAPVFGERKEMIAPLRSHLQHRVSMAIETLEENPAVQRSQDYEPLKERLDELVREYPERYLAVQESGIPKRWSGRILTAKFIAGAIIGGVTIHEGMTLALNEFTKTPQHGDYTMLQICAVSGIVVGGLIAMRIQLPSFIQTKKRRTITQYEQLKNSIKQQLTMMYEERE